MDITLGRLASSASVETAYLRSLGRYSRAREFYPRIQSPVTLVYGEKDWSKPAERVATSKLVPGSKLQTLKRTGHFSALERPEEVAKILIAAAASAPATTNAAAASLRSSD